MEEVLLHLDIQRKIQEQYLMSFQGAAERIRLVGAAEAGAAEARGRAEATLILNDNDDDF